MRLLSKAYALALAACMAAPLYGQTSLRTDGLTREGSETGTSQTPDLEWYLDGVYEGAITRRLISHVTTAGEVVAQTLQVRLERDGTDGGLRIAWNDGSFEILFVYGTALTNAGALLPIRITVDDPSTAGSLLVVSDDAAVVHVRITFGTVYNTRDHSDVTLSRAPGDTHWFGTLTSTFNQ